MTNVMLHVHNVLILGGVPTFIYDLAAAFPQFTHFAMHVKDVSERSAAQMLNDQGVRVLHGPLTEAVVREIDPAILVLHNISGNSVEGESPWAWLRQWPTIYWHHSKVAPAVKADLHVFVSHYLKGQYSNLTAGGFIQRHKVIPPCIQTSRFAKVERAKDRSIGKLATPTRPEKYPYVLVKVAKATDSKLVMPGANKFYQSDNGRLVSLLPSWHKVPWFLSRMGIFVYVNAPSFGPETWCRGVTEALAAGLPVIAEDRGGIREQITDRQTGFLVAPDDEYLIRARIEELYENPDLAKQIGAAGRKWAQENADIKVLQRELTEELLSMVVGRPL